MNLRQELVLLAATPDLALEALRWTEAACDRAGLDAAGTYALAAAVVEAVNNSLEHGYALAPGEITLALDAAPDRIVVTISDRGKGLPPQPPAAMPAPLAERGRGSWIMRQNCDEVRHEIGAGAQRVVLVKHRARRPQTCNGDLP